MNQNLRHDRESQTQLLESIVHEAASFLKNLPNHPPATLSPSQEIDYLPNAGIGTQQALTYFQAKYTPNLSGSAGPRYFGFVTGGVTPAAIVGDWLTTIYDQNVMAADDSIAPQVEKEAISWLRQLFGLPDTFAGTFVSGATMSNFAGLAQGRQWAAQQQGIDVVEDGLYGLAPTPVLSATPHVSILKSLAMLGMGRQVTAIPTLPEREAVDVTALTGALHNLAGQPCIVVANAGTVNSADFDHLQTIARLKMQYNFWLHVDGAFGGFAACSPQFSHLIAGISQADSITIDAHKWLNVPYDSAMQFSRHPELQLAMFRNAAIYLGGDGESPSLVHWTPQNSRRFRALPAWMTLLAYGKDGYRDIVERNCRQAAWLGAQIKASSQFKLLAPVKLNVVCFTLVNEPTMAKVKGFLAQLRDDGRVYLTPTQYGGMPAIRAAFSNWQTEMKDVEICWQAMQELEI